MISESESEGHEMWIRYLTWLLLSTLLHESLIIDVALVRSGYPLEADEKTEPQKAYLQ